MLCERRRPGSRRTAGARQPEEDVRTRREGFDQNGAREPSRDPPRELALAAPGSARSQPRFPAASALEPLLEGMRPFESSTRRASAKATGEPPSAEGPETRLQSPDRTKFLERLG